MLLKRGKHVWFVAAAALCAAGFAAAVAVGGAAGERCGEHRCAGKTTTERSREHRTSTRKATTTTKTTTTQKASGAASATASSQILFNGGFETGSYAPWLPPQCHNYANTKDNGQVHFGTFSVDSSGVGQGRYGGRFTVPAWSGGRTRCEVLTQRTVNVGGDDYYALMVNFPAGWSPGTKVFWGVNMVQLNWEGFPGAPVDLQAHSDHVTVALQTGACGTTCQYRSNAEASNPNLPNLYAIPRPMQLGVWHELVVHVHWATNSSGQVEVWHRIKGQSAWTKTASLSGYPTLATSPSGSYPTHTADKIGVYRPNSYAPTTLLMDGFTRSGSFATASGSLP